MEGGIVTTRHRGLIVDDKKEQADKIVQGLKIAFKKIDVVVDWEFVGSALEACSRIAAEEPFDVAILDYELELAENALSVVDELRDKAPRCYILVVTGVGHDYPLFADLARGRGADAAIHRKQLTLTASATDEVESWDYHSLAARLSRHLTVQGWDGKLNVSFAKTAGIEAMLHDLGTPPGADGDVRAQGERVARSLILECLDERNPHTTLRVEHLAAGKSGAFVCKVRGEQQGLPARTHVIKMGLNRAALEAEYRINKEASEALSPGALITFADRARKDPQSDYWALASRFADDTTTLDGWLARAATLPTQARAVAEEIFGRCLAPLFQEGLSKDRTTASWFAMSPVHVLRVREAIATYTPVWGSPDGAGVHDAEQLAAELLAFVDERILSGPKVPPLPARVTYVHGFGDLHSGNVLVRTAGQPWPWLVDASGYGPQHWAGDATRLIVDLVLLARRTGMEPMLWTSVAADAEFAGDLCGCAAATPATPATVEPPVRPVDAFIAAVVARRREFLHLDELGLREADWHWQWHVALAREFLRQGARPGLMPTSVVLALTAAAGHLRRAVTALDAGSGLAGGS
jgi:CheY-like chemotaxis protein